MSIYTSYASKSLYYHSHYLRYHKDLLSSR